MLGMNFPSAKLLETVTRGALGLGSSAPIECAVTLMGKLGNVVPHFDEAKFNQRHQIALANGRKFGSPGFDIAQHPAQTYRSVEI